MSEDYHIPDLVASVPAPTEEQVAVGIRAIDEYYNGTKDAPFAGSIAYVYRAMRALEGQTSDIYKDQKLYSDGFKAGYAQAIGDADEALKKQGDDRQTRLARRDVLALAGVHYDPAKVNPIPDWTEKARS